MRKLLTILLLFAACALKAQYTPNSGAYSYKGLMPLKSLQLPTDCGYPVTAIHAPDSSRSAIYFDSCNALLYRFDPKPKTWSVILDSVGAGSVVTLQLAYDGSISAGDNPLINGGGQGRTFNIDSVNFIDLRALPSGGNGYAVAQIMSRSPEALNKVGLVGTAYQHIGGDTIIQAFIGALNEPTQVGNVIYLYDTTAYLLQRFSTTELIEQKFSHPPPIEDNRYYIPLTVNGNPADSAGNIVVNVVSGIDSLFITNTDSIFIISGGDTIFVGINDDGCTNGIKQPGYVTWSGDGLTFDVTAGFFTLDCTLYDGNAGSITLDPADPTFPRFDVIGWDTTGAVIKVTGTAGMNPAIPQVDPSYQIGLTVINIPAGATVPGGITQDVIYDENNEDWTGAVSGITVNLDNTTNPYHLTKSADAGTWSPAPKTLTFTNDTGYIDANDYGILKLFISLKESIATVGNIRVSFLNDGDAVSNIVSLGGGVGFNKSIADTYQNISVPLSSFIFTSTVFNQVRITFAGSGDGAYIDYIQLQGGITPPSIAGVYQDTTYSRNDSLFGRKNNTEFFIQHLTLARLPQLWGIYINNDDSTYDPYGLDVGIGVDTAKIRDWIVNTVISGDTTISQVVNNADFIVKFHSGSPVADANGDKYLVSDPASGAFAGHENDVAEKVGGVYTFTEPALGDNLIVNNSVTSTFESYQFNGTTWVLQNIVVLAGGNRGIGNLPIGTKDSADVIIKAFDTAAIIIDPLRNVKLPEFANLEDSNLYFRPTVDGKIDTAYFNELIAGTGITITPGPNRTDTIKSTGGGGGGGTVTKDGAFNDSIMQDGSLAFRTVQMFNVYDYGAVADGTTDATAGIQAAINACVAAGGGIVYFPYSTQPYIIAGALQTSVSGVNPNSQLYIPLVTADTQMVSITLQGASPTSYASEETGVVPRTTQGVVLYSTLLNGSGTIPAILGSPWYNAGVVGDRNYVEVTINNMEFRTQTLTAGGVDTVGSMSAINGSKFLTFSGDELHASISSTITNSLQPTNETYGIILPDVNNHSKIDFGSVFIEGYYWGLQATEHMQIDHLSMVICRNAIKVVNGYHTGTITVASMGSNVNNIVLAGTMPLTITSYEPEHAPAALGKWYTFESDIKQVSGSSRVQIFNANIVNSGIGVVDSLVTSGNPNYVVFNGQGSIPSGQIHFGDRTLFRTNSSADLYFDKTNARLGVGTSSPSDKLHLYGSGSAVGQYVETTSGSGEAYIHFRANGAIANLEAFGASFGNPALQNAFTFTSLVNNSGTINFLTTTGGSAVSRLKINNGGTITVNGAYALPSAGGSQYGLLSLDGSNNATWGNPTRIGIGGAPSYPLDVTGSAGYIARFADGTRDLRIFTAAGFAGLGSSASHDVKLFVDDDANRSVTLKTSTANFLVGNIADDGTNKLQVNGSVKATQYRLSALNAAPSSASDTGTAGEIRITSTFIYVCVAANTWVRAALATW